MSKGASKIVFVTALTLLVAAYGASLPAATRSAPSSVSSSPENIRISDHWSEEPHLVIDSRGRLFVTWKEKLLSHRCLEPGVFARSLDGGLTWSKSAVPLLTSTFRYGGHSDPWLAVDELDRIYYSRLEAHTDVSSCEGPPNYVVVSRSDDGGATWGPMIDVGLGIPDKPTMESDRRGAIYVVYTNDDHVSVTRSTDGGATWSPERPMETGATSGVVAARPDGKVFVAWVEVGWPNQAAINIKLSASRDRGETWSEPVRVNPHAGSLAGWVWNYNIATRQPSPSIVTNSRGTVFVAWSDRVTGDNDILVSRSDDDGATWSVPVRVNDTPTGDQWSGMLAIDANDALHSAWYDTRSGKINLYYANSTDGGRTWGPNLRVTTQDFDTRRVSEYFGLAADRHGVAYLAWTDGRDSPFLGPTYIYFARTPPVSPPAAPEPCVVASDTLCLNGGRFRVEVDWRVPSQGSSGEGRAVPLTGDTGYFWFFSDNNVELVIKVLDGRPVNGKFWVFYGALSDVEYTIRVTDTETGAVKTYTNPSGNLASVADTSAF